MEMMTHKTVPPTMIAVRISRSRVGISSCFKNPIQSESSDRASWKVALIRSFPRRTLDNRNCGRAHAEKILVRIFDFDPDGEPLRDADPVQFAFYVRHAGGRQIDFALGLHCPSDSLDFSTEALVRRGREVNNRFAAGSHMSNLRFAKICDDIPFAGVQQRKDGNPGCNMSASRNVEIDDTSVERCDDLAVG